MKASWRLRLVVALIPLALDGCGAENGSDPAPVPASQATPAPTPNPTQTPTTVETFRSTTIATFDYPQFLVQLYDDNFIVGEKSGKLWIVSKAGTRIPITGTLPTVSTDGEGGLIDLGFDPLDFDRRGQLFLTYTEAAGSGSALVVASAQLGRSLTAAALTGLRPIWRSPELATTTRYGGSISVTSDYLNVAVGDREQAASAQDLGSTLGKTIRLTLGGAIPAGNPFSSTPGAQPEIWTYGHRTSLGRVGRDLLEASPAGDELNILQAGRNYGWPRAANGAETAGDIPDHSATDGFTAPSLSWTPPVRPTSGEIYNGRMWPEWFGTYILSTLDGQGLIRVQISGSTATEIERYPLGTRIRRVVEDYDDGSLWVLEDGPAGRLRRLTRPS